MKYERVLVYTKKGNLLDYACTDKVMRSFSSANSASLKEFYGNERDIQLIAQIRWETNGQYGKEKCICCIKCPVNPMPVKGEFELPSLDSLRMFLKANGWELKQDLYCGLFK